jgi:hypothetical protein
MTEPAGSNDAKMSDFEIALMDAISTIFEVLVAKKIVSAETVAEMLRRQREAYPKGKMPGAVFLTSWLIERLTDPARGVARKLEREPSQGSA